MEKNNLIVGNISISSEAIRKIVLKELKTFDSFKSSEVKVEIEDNRIEIKLTIEFIIELKTYKAVIDLLENQIFNSIQYFSSTKSNIQIRIK
jgi:tRNA threonylcarbamoyladenosine modification (KEOPS) complex  Pcc1 subunit